MNVEERKQSREAASFIAFHLYLAGVANIQFYIALTAVAAIPVGLLYNRLSPRSSKVRLALLCFGFTCVLMSCESLDDNVRLHSIDAKASWGERQSQ